MTAMTKYCQRWLTASLGEGMRYVIENRGQRKKGMARSAAIVLV